MNSEKRKIIGTGLQGLVGSRVVELLQDKYDFENISRSTGVEISNYDQVMQAITASDASVILHLAAKTNVDACEEDKILAEEGEAWKVNVVGTKNVVEAAKETNKKLIYISTDFVFNGENSPADGYGEEAIPHPINWYGETKYTGEKILQEADIPSIIVRPSFPYGRPYAKKKDFVQAILARLQNHESITGVTDQIFMPTLIDDIAIALDSLITNNAQGIYHVTGSQALSPYDASLLIAKSYGYPISLVGKTTRAEFFRSRAERPYKLLLKHDRINLLGVKMRGFEEGLLMVKK